MVMMLGAADSAVATVCAVAAVPIRPRPRARHSGVRKGRKKNGYGEQPSWNIHVDGREASVRRGDTTRTVAR
jgi:hypothetical protein